MTGKRGKRKNRGTEDSRAVTEARAEEEAGGTGAEVEEAGAQKRGMEGLPVELIGNILSRIADVKDVVRASWTCRKWRLALRHLHALRRVSCGQPKKEELESVTTDTLLQTMGLQKLHISSTTTISATAVDTWLSHTAESLRDLTLWVPMPILDLDVFERCGRMKCLQSLYLSPGDMRFTADPTVQLFPCLLSLCLSCVKVLAVDLQALVSACQKLESLSLKSITFSDPGSKLTITSVSLKSFVCYSCPTLDSVMLEADVLESLDLRRSNFTNFELKTGARLRSLGIHDVTIPNLDLGNNDTDCLDVEEVEVKRSCGGVWAAIGSFLSKPSLKLRRLQLSPLRALPENLNLQILACLFPNLEAIAFAFPLFKHLDMSSTAVENNSLRVESQLLQSSSVFERVWFFELGYPHLDNDLVILIGGALRRCPHLRKLQVKCKREPALQCEFMTSFVKLVRKFSNVDIEFRPEL